MKTASKQEDSNSFAKTLGCWLEEVGKGLLSPRDRDQDTALFGRMVADKPEFNVEAACAVSHAITTHAFAVEGDYFSAGEELNRLKETGAAITSYAFFGSGVYYQHATCNLHTLYENLKEGEGRTPEAVDERARAAVNRAWCSPNRLASATAAPTTPPPATSS